MGLDWLAENRLADLHSIKREMISTQSEIIDLSMINPDISVPRQMLDKLMEAEGNPRNHKYSVSRGTKRLREAFAERYSTLFGVELCLDAQICVTFGTKDAIYNLLRCCTKQGDTALIAKPSYPVHIFASQLAGLDIHFFETLETSVETAEGLVQKIQELKPSVLILNYPNNPTGVVFSKQDWRLVADAAISAGTFIINDFVYGELHWSSESASLLESVDNLDSCVEVFSMSKAYSIPGWRVGAALGCSKVVGDLARLKSYLDYGLYIPIQQAASFGLQEGSSITSGIAGAYQRRTSLLSEGLKGLGWEVQTPKAGCSVWAKYPQNLSSGSSMDFAAELMRNTGVLVGPGCLYGNDYDHFVRFACVQGDRFLNDVLDRLKQFQEA